MSAIALDRLEAIAEDAGASLENASAADVLRWAAETFEDRWAVAASMGDTVLAHLAGQIAPGVPVLFLDTGYHFPETLGTRDAVAATYPVRLINLTPAQTVAEQDQTYGARLHDRDPDLCCAMRKVAPLEKALESYDAWASGVRRAESPERAATPVVAWDAKRRKVKINPLARWTQADVDAYAEQYSVLMNPLLFDGYPSVGCAPCTRRVPAGEDPRAGRWAGLAKTECGINS